MCTLTVIRGAHGLIVTINRDEQRTRQEVGTLLTGRSDVTGLYYCHPLDSLHGGTWFGCNSAGVVLALLNRYPEQPVEFPESRGLIISSLISYGSVAEILQLLREGAARNCNPHDLILIDKDTLVRCTWDGSTCQISEGHTRSAFMLSSSSVFPARTIAYRQELFQKWLNETEEDSRGATQILSQFHLQQDPADPSASVLMSRPHSHTKSITQARLAEDAVDFVYLNEATVRDLTPGVTPSKLPVHRLSITTQSMQNHLQG
ncbi:MAG: NRDE family protein [Gammaproteobacteria bacterium]|nr:NRDE family protein [Gammaproteobacteria bacterium]MDP2346440.1 NRDE family protein [Gammaproteobacteria bacterium]